MENNIKNKIDYFEEINNARTFYLTEISESKNRLRLVIEESSVRGGKSKFDSEYDTEYEIIFESYIGFSILDESYALPNDNEFFQGNHFRLYTVSDYLDYIKKVSFACNEHPGPFHHYELCCLNHIIDIVSISLPIINKNN